jgi:hypothetical protein
MEISGAMAAASLLGLPSTVSSHDFWYLFVWPAITAAKANQTKAGIIDICSQVGHKEPSPAVQTEDHAPQPETTSDSSVSDVLLQGEEYLIEDAPLDAGLHDCVADFVVDKKGKVTVVPQHINYMHRGAGLKDFCLYDYAGCIVIQKKKEKHNMDSGASQPHHGRLPNQVFSFDAGHPLAASHEQHLRSKQLVPILAGMPPPRYPGPRASTTLWRDSAQRYAEFMLTAFVPWDLQVMAPTMVMNWGSFCTWAAERSSSNSEAPMATHYV